MIILRHAFPLRSHIEVRLPGYVRTLHAAPLRARRAQQAGFAQPYVEMWFESTGPDAPTLEDPIGDPT